jgi:transposase
MWEGYVTAAQEALPAATIVIDRFHVARQYRDAVEELRKQEVKRLRKELPEEQREELKQTLWPFRKRPSELDEAEQARLDVLLRAC